MYSRYLTSNVITPRGHHGRPARGFPKTTPVALKPRPYASFARLDQFGPVLNGQAVALTGGQRQGVVAGICAFDAHELPPPAPRCRGGSQVRETGCLLLPWTPHDGRMAAALGNVNAPLEEGIDNRARRFGVYIYPVDL